MSLRVRLILAFFLLSVVPLTAVTYVSYASSAAALRDAAEQEADRLAGELGQRMQVVTNQLSERVEHLVNISELQARVEDVEQERATMDIASVQAESESSADQTLDADVGQQVADALGAAAMLLNNVELRGLGGRRGGGRGPSGRGDGGGDGRGADGSGRGGSPPPRPEPPPVPVPPGEAGADEPLRIDLGAMRRDLFRQLTQEELQENQTAEDLTSEQRSRLFREVNARMAGIAEGIQLGAEQLQRRAEAARQQSARAGGSSPAAPTASPSAPVAPVSGANQTRTVAALDGRRLGVTLERDGEVVRTLSAEINLPNMLSTVFSTTRQDQTEVPFAVDPDGRVYARSPADRATIEGLGAVATPNGPTTARVADWIVVTTTDPAGSGLRMGIARPMGDSLAQLRRASAANLGIGLGFITLALIGIVPLSGRLTRNLSVMGDAVERISQGDYRARVPVRSQDEVGQLARAFNRMAADVEEHQQQAVGQERIRRELELGRRIQNDMLPHAPLRLGLTEIRGVSVPAKEVGGDFFNYFELPSGQLALLVGDVSGKGVGAALLMANIQGSLRTRLALGQNLSDIADAIDRDVETNSPGPDYATLFVGILDPISRELRFVNAGHNPQYVLRKAGGLDRMHSSGLPVGMIAGRGYTEERVQLDAGDLLFFYTDGCVEAENEAGDMLGSERLEELLKAGGSDAQDVLVRVEAAVKDFRGGREASDDATTMAVAIG